MKMIKISELLPMLENVKRGTLREAFDGEAPDLVLERDKLCTGITMVKHGKGFSVNFAVPLQLIGGIGYVFEE